MTSEDIQRMAKKYIRPDKANIVVVGNKDDVTDKLRSIAPIKYFDTYGNEIELRPNESVDIEPRQLVMNYIEAIGGKDKLMGVKET